MCIMETTFVTPKSFLKSRRPERFSDTVINQVTVLDRSLLEFHLSTLTSRNQHTDFEQFARELCQYEICPNLLPQTGPTGGGDSKVDSETYPVADNLAYGWYIGIGRQAANERWALAFSAKTEWRSKFRSDIEKIVNTKRGYTKAFFVTNQSVSDKKRAELEDSLRSKHDIDVRILDRTWILDRVFKNGHEELAIKELKVTGLSHRKVKKGPLDVKREGELKEVEKRIIESTKSGLIDHIAVDDAIRAADLARNLEHPRPEIEGRYIRAESMAKNYGTIRQQIEVAYQLAWTLFWWFEDYNSFADKYDVVEQRAIGSKNAYDLEQLSALWFSLHGAVFSGNIIAKSAAYIEHTDVLIAELERLKCEKDRPSTALQSETLLLEVHLMRRISDNKPADDILNSLRDVLIRSEGLVGYPMESFINSLTEICQTLEDSKAYEDLFETAVKIASRRDGETTAARFLLVRGEKQLLKGKAIKAISTLGRSLGRLYKHETRHEIIRALYFCGCAYDEIGLPWAARGTLLSAASIATDDFWKYGKVTPYQAACYRRLKWIELSLGRLPHLLVWHELDTIIRKELINHGYDSKDLQIDDPAINALIIRLFLRTDFGDLKSMQNLPDILDRLELDFGADALLYLLGHNERFEKVASTLDEDPHHCASKWYNIKANVALPDRPELYNKQKVLLTSNVLGCKININSSTSLPCVEVAESILATLESFLATTALDHAIAREPELNIAVRISDFADEPICVSVEEKVGRPSLVVSCKSFDPYTVSIDEQIILREAVFKVNVTALSQFIVFRDAEHDLEELFRDERILDRSVAFSSTLGTQSNVLGTSPKTQMSSWFDEETNNYPLLRKEPWEPEEEINGNKQKESPTMPMILQGVEPPPELLNTTLKSHTQIETVSLIRDLIWNRAGWSGVVFFIDLTYKSSPVMGLIFRNHDAGRDIFMHWRKELGKIDRSGQLRLTIVRGIDQSHPHAYRVLLGSNPDVIPEEARFINYVYRIHRMDASTSENLDRFLKAFKEVGTFFLVPAFAPADFDGSQTPKLDMNYSVGMHSILIRDAWQIGPHEIEAVAIQNDDDPVIPDGEENVPVLNLFRSRKQS